MIIYLFYKKYNKFLQKFILNFFLNFVKNVKIFNYIVTLFIFLFNFYQ